MYTVKVEIKDSNIAGKGYFAMQDIPSGTIIYFYGEEDKRYTKAEYENMAEKERLFLFENGVENEFGDWVLTASGPYTNHSCDANILPFFINGKYTSIVVKDIKAGDEITIDYGQFYSSEKWSLDCKCGCAKCREKVGFALPTDIETEKDWEDKLKDALLNLFIVPQPIYELGDKYAKEITDNLRSFSKVTLGKQIKFSLIKDND